VVRAATLLAALALAGAQAQSTTFAAAGDAATATLLHVWYAGDGLWRECDDPGCNRSNMDWGVDSLTYALWLRWQTTHDSAIPQVMRELTATAPPYPLGETWSDNPEWDAIAAVRMYQVTGDAAALAKARAAFDTVEGSADFALGACPEIRYQQPQGRDNQLKTLESDANAIKAALLLHQATGEQSYLASAVRTYAAVRKWFLDPKLALYSVYVFDDGRQCTQVPHRFFASVNGDMIWNGLELARATGDDRYRADALATGRAVAAQLTDAAGVFADLQAENDIAEPLVEGMYALATDPKAAFARAWILTNAAAALSARTSDGSFGRFFDGPAPQTLVTAWQTNGGLAVEIAAGALDPAGSASADRWQGARRVSRSIGLGDTITIHARAVALLGTLGEACCEPGHARVFVDARETTDGTGIWQNKSSSGKVIPNAVLFAWRWPRLGRHTIRFEPGVQNGKEGGPYLHLTGYLVR
jgi:hypothetical protein